MVSAFDIKGSDLTDARSLESRACGCQYPQDFEVHLQKTTIDPRELRIWI